MPILGINCNMEQKINHLSDFIRHLRSKGECVFLKKEALWTLGVSENAFRKSVSRLINKGSVAYIKKGLYMTIPDAYFHAKTIPPEWYIDQLMNHLKRPYYVGLLSAAALHGAAHQAPQSFQVITDNKMRPLLSDKLNIKFHYSKNFHLIPTQKIKTTTGYISVSTPEGTAFDLIRYIHQSGNINHVATVLSELGEVINSIKLVEIGKKFSIYHCQKLGYLLDLSGHTELSEDLFFYTQKNSLRYIPLRSDLNCKNADKNEKWHVLINEKIDIDI